MRLGFILPLVFCVSFAAPILFGVGWSWFRPIGGAENEQITDFALFPAAFELGREARAVRVAKSAHIRPELGKDFVVSAWVKFTKLPRSGQRQFLFTKLSRSESARDTARPASSYYQYALAFDGHERGIRPAIYWRNNSQQRRAQYRVQDDWYTFSDFVMLPEEWYHVALIVRGSSLALYIATPKPDGKASVELVGGYEVSNTELPGGEGDFIIGFPGNESLRAAVGQFCVVSESDVTDDTKEFVRSITIDANRLMKHHKDSLLLCTRDGKTDASPEHLTLKMPRSVSK
jgi:hypothetical protein